MAMAGDGDGLRDLELIMDCNLDFATAFSSSDNTNTNTNTNTKEEDMTEHQSSGTATATKCGETERVNRHFVPCGNVASLSLALGTLTMPSNLVLSKVGVLKAPMPAPKSPSLPSQKKAHAPLPVVPSSKLKVGLDLEHQSSVQKVSKKITGSVTAFPDYQMLPKSGKGYGHPSGGAAMKKASIVWFRNDLRVHDNEALSAANKESLSVTPVYCFDPKDYGKSVSGFDKTGPYRAKFLLDCVANLRDSLRERGSDLVVRIGNPEEVLSTIAKAIGADGLYAHQEVSAEELGMEQKVSASLKDQGVDVKFFWGSTLFHVDDLPFKLEDMPSNYGGFREKVKDVQVRAAAEAPKQYKGLSSGDVKPGSIPTLQELGLGPVAATGQERHSPRGGPLTGGEAEALRRLQTFALDAPPTTTKGKNKVSESIYGANFSSKISPWLAMGCLSPRKMFEDLRKNSSRFVPKASSENDGGDSGMQWLVFELLWRDFFRFITRKYGATKRIQTPAGVPAMACA